MKAYFTSLNPREQKMVLAAALFVLLFLPYQFIYTPFQNSLTKMEKSAIKAKKNIVWMKNSSREIRGLRGTNNPTRKSRQSLLSLIETTTKQSKLNKNLSKVQPAGSTLVKVQLNEVSFDNLMLWLDKLVMIHGLSIQYFKIEKQKDNGIVNVRVDVSTE